MENPTAKYDLTGRLFGALKAEKLVDGINTRSRWLCKCISSMGGSYILAWRNIFLKRHIRLDTSVG